MPTEVNRRIEFIRPVRSEPANDDAGEERLIPFDMVPRIITGSEWRRLAKGIEQRVRAINAFLHDVYHRQEIVRSGRMPQAMLQKALPVEAMSGLALRLARPK